MKKIEFWVTINGSISDSDGRELWSRIKHGKDINLTVLGDEAFVYGTTTEFVLADVIFHCVHFGHPIQLNTE